MTVHLLIHGKVQGVFYRASAKDLAEKLDIKGWIKNTEEGNVEIICTGEEESIKEFTSWCRKGPPLAKVNQVDLKEEAETAFEEFTVIRKKR